MLKKISLIIISLITCFSLFWANPAWADLNDDRYDGNIFVIYAGNGSLVPPRLSLKESLARKMPVLLVYYVDDSKDCKQYSIVISRLQEFYGKPASFIPIPADSIPVKKSYSPDEEGYYFKGSVPQTVILDANGKVVFDQVGQAKYEDIDDTFRKVFDLLPRSQSLELKRRIVNEQNLELVPVEKPQ